MSAISTLKKQGGMTLLKRYAKSGALFTAVAEFLILGKKRKALEILRLAADYKTKEKLQRKYGDLLADFDNQYDKCLAHNQSGKVWVCWFQGIDNAPDLVKKCYESLKNKMNDGNSTITVRVMDFTGIGSDTRQFYKSDITGYGSN